MWKWPAVFFLCIAALLCGLIAVVAAGDAQGRGGRLFLGFGTGCAIAILSAIFTAICA